MYVPLFTDFTRSRVLVSTVFTRFTVNPVITGSSPCFSQKLFQAIFFGTVRLNLFRHCATFSNLFCLQKVPPSSFFATLQQTKVPKSPKGLPFYAFRYYETVQNFNFSFFSKIFLKKFENFLSPKAPLQLIWYFATNWIFKKPKGSPFYNLKNFALFES